MGSKARIVHEILPIMLDKEHDTFVDAFCGGCSVIENVPDTYRRIANDKNRYLIEMWKHLQDGGFVFSHISKETYDKARDCYHGKNNFFTEAGVGLVGFMASFNGRFFDGGYSGHNVVGKNGKARDYIREQIENTMRDVPLIKGVEFYSGSYDELVIPERSIVYCDIPYKATKSMMYQRTSIMKVSIFGAWKWLEEDIRSLSASIRCRKSSDVSGKRK